MYGAERLQLVQCIKTAVQIQMSRKGGQCVAQKGKVKVNVQRTLEQATKSQRGRFISTLSLTSAFDGVGGQRHIPAALPPGKTRYPLYRRLGGPQGRSEQVLNISPPRGFDTRTVQPVASRYTD